MSLGGANNYLMEPNNYTFQNYYYSVVFRRFMSRIISFSSDDSFSDGLENTITKSGYKNRSRFMRDAILHFADYKQRGELESMDADEFIEGHLIIYYQHGIENKLVDIRHSEDIDVANYNHSCLKQSHTCVDLIQGSGKASGFRKVIEMLQNTVSVDKVVFVSAPMREEGCC
jgi:metal-responsive CopG/Arc/MetJ family transcriptional regulator